MPKVTVTDLVPLAEGDATGAGLAASVFPLVLGGMIGGILLSLIVQGVVRRLVGLVVFGAAAGALIMLVMQTWFGILQGDWLLNATVVGVGVMATAAFIVAHDVACGPSRHRDRRGRDHAHRESHRRRGGTAAVPSRAVGRGRTVLRAWSVGNTAAVGGRTSRRPPTLMQWLVLGAWLVGGVLLALVGHFRSAAEIHPPARQLEKADKSEAHVETETPEAAVAAARGLTRTLATAPPCPGGR